MKEQLLKLIKNKLFIAVVINVIILGFCVYVTSFSYQNSSDFYNSFYICHEHFYFSSSLNYFLCLIAGSLQYLFPTFNCFVLSLIMLSFVAFTSLTYILLDKFGYRKGIVFSLAINILFCASHYSNVSSKQTSALLLAAGMLVFLNCIRNRRYRLSFWFALLECLAGAFLCIEYFFVSLIFLFAFFVSDMIARKKYRIRFRKFFWSARPYVLIVALLSVLVTGFSFWSYSINNFTPQNSYYYEYSSLYNSISNSSFPSYNGNEVAFAEKGINENDYDLLKSGYYDADNSLNLGTMRLVSKLQNQQDSSNIFTRSNDILTGITKNFSEFSCQTLVICSLAVMIILYLIFQRKCFCLFPIFLGIATYFSSIYLRTALNGSYNSIYGVWLFYFLFLLFSFDFGNLKYTFEKLLDKTHLISLFICIGAVVGLAIGYTMLYQNDYNSSLLKTKPSALYTEVERHPERYYVFDTTTYEDYTKHTNNYTHPLWGFNSSFMCNVDSFGYNHNNVQLRSRNLSENIYKTVLNGDRVFVIDNYITYKKEKYFRVHYTKDDKKVSYSLVDEIDGFKIYAVVTL